MNEVLTEEERKFIKDLKKEKIFHSFSKEEFKGITVNGGVGIFCSDGDIDVYNYHQKVVTKRSHSIQIFGGILNLAPSFEGYKAGFARGIISNIKLGMKAKNTKTIFLYSHYPCGVASSFNLKIWDVVRTTEEVRERLVEVFSFDETKIHCFFYVKKRENKGKKEEQNTYLFYPELL